MTETAEKVQVPSGTFWGTGRRKTAVARVRLISGEGKVRVNERDIKEYFVCARQVESALAPLRSAKMAGKLDVLVAVEGGGPFAQGDAVKLGVARAMCKMFPDLERDLRDLGYLTRDAREVERKKPGRCGARRRFQFSKR